MHRTCYSCGPLSAIILLILLTVFLQCGYATTSGFSSSKCISEDGEKLKWTIATTGELIKHLYPDELCVIISLSRQFQHQSVNMGIECSGKREFAWDNLLKNSSVSGCSIAGTSYYCHTKSPGQFLYTDNKCGATIQDKVSYFASHFANLAVPLQGSGVPHVVSLYNTLKRLEYRHMPFMGDSISQSLFLSLKGTWARSMTLVDSSVLDMRAGSYIPCRLKKISRATIRPQDCFTPNNTLCTDDKQAEFIKNFTIRTIAGEGVINLDPDGSIMSMKDAPINRTLMIFHPFGVHIWQEDVGVVQGIARGIVEAGRWARAHNCTLLILECPAQHFVYDVNRVGSRIPDSGNHSGDFQPGAQYHRHKFSGPCCRKTMPGNSGNFRNLALLEALTTVDPNWREIVGWIPFYDVSQQVYNGHVDSNADCTHFAYSPMFFDALWQAIECEVVRLQPAGT